MNESTCMTCDEPFTADGMENHCPACTWEATLDEARRRMSLGEPLSTTAAEIGLTPSELQEHLDQ